MDIKRKNTYLALAIGAIALSFFVLSIITQWHAK